MARDPYCRNCGYSLRGLTESSKCPECGLPIVEVLEREPGVPRGKRYRSAIELFGLPLVHIAFGAHEDESYGKARGIIAIGDTARGWVAIGGWAIGLIAIGGVAVGPFAIGGWAIGLAAIGGGAMGAAVCGGGAVGLVAVGGGAIGVIADGGGVIAYYGRGGGVWARHTLDWRRKDPEAVALFDKWAWLLGSLPRANSVPNLTFAAWILASGVLLAFMLTCVLLISYAMARRRSPQ